MKRVVGYAVALVILLGCSKMSTPTEPVTGSGKLTVNVHEGSSAVGIANVTVEIRDDQSGPVVLTTTTNASGVADIVLPARTYWVSVVPPAGYSFTGGPADTLGASLPLGSGGIAVVTFSLVRTK